jgi:2-keto-4-pentenoate hydratase
MTSRLALAALLCLPALAGAACPDDAEVAAYAADFAAVRPAHGLPTAVTLEDALCSQGKVVRALEATWGPVVGYKAGLTNKAVQARFGVDSPVRAIMLRDMLLPDGAELPAAFGARPIWEADFLAVVGRRGLHQANSPEEALDFIDAVVPFIELPDLMLAPEVKLTAPALVAANVGTRLGVVGTPIRVGRDGGFAASLAGMTVVAEENGVELARGPGSALMGNPLEAALWLARALHAEGIELEPGQVLSLGSFLPPMPPKPGTTVVVRYLGLEGDPAVSVNFR